MSTGSVSTGSVSIGVVSTGVVSTGPPPVKFELCGAGIDTVVDVYSLIAPLEFAILIVYVAPSVNPSNSINSDDPIAILVPTTYGLEAETPTNST